jgi:hypothetical protein
MIDVNSGNRKMQALTVGRILARQRFPPSLASGVAIAADGPVV